MSQAHYEWRQIPGGPRLAVATVADAECAALTIHVPAGSRDESDLPAGLAHFVEHMVFKGTFNTVKGFMRALMKAEDPRIINIASVIGLIGNAGQANYAASKAGLIGFTKSVARELAGRAVTCNAVAPGFITTDMTGELPEKIREEVLTKIPLSSFGETKDIAETVAFLASPAARYITGQVLAVDGGMTM